MIIVGEIFYSKKMKLQSFFSYVFYAFCFCSASVTCGGTFCIWWI